MKPTILAFLLGTAALHSPALAGGPVITEEAAITEEAPRSEWAVPVILGLIALCAIACGSEGGPDVKPGPVCQKEGC